MNKMYCYHENMNRMHNSGRFKLAAPYPDSGEREKRHPRGAEGEFIPVGL
ncbi:Hypothetical protein ABZS17D1_00203 [Kosakonia cowanii]